MNGCFYFLKNTKAITYFQDSGVAALLFAALMHDVDHPGNNNDYEKNSKSTLSLLYNDVSILENHHSSLAF
jgi:hypothetical protein